MEYKSLDQMDETEIAESFNINFTSVYELEKELRYYGRREAELVRKAIDATKRFNKMLTNLKIEEATLISKIKHNAIASGKPIASSAFGEIRKSMLAENISWQDAQKAATNAQAKADLWNGLLTAWKSRGFRLQELAKIAERTLWNDPVVMEESIPRESGVNYIHFNKNRREEHKIDLKLDAQDNLQF